MLGEVLGYRHVILVLTCLLSFGLYFAFDMPSVLQTPLSSLMIREWSAKTDSYYNLMYLVYSWSSAAFVLFSGIVVDTLGLRRSTFLFLVLAFLGQTMIAASSQGAQSFGLDLQASFILVIVGRAILGCGSSAVGVVQRAFCKKWFCGKEVSLALGVTLAFSRFGSWINYRFTPTVFGDFCEASCGDAYVYAPDDMTMTPVPHVPGMNASALLDSDVFNNGFFAATAVPVPAPPGTRAYPQCDWITNSSLPILPATCIDPLTNIFWIADLFILLGVIACVVIAVADIYGDKHYQSADAAALFAARPFDKESIITLVKLPGFWLVCVCIGLLYSAVFPFQANAPAYLSQTFSNGGTIVTLTEASRAVGWIAFMAMCGSAVVGYASDLVGLRALFGLVAASIFVFVFGSLTFFPGSIPLVPLMLITGCGYVLMASTVWPILQLVVPANAIGTANGIAGCLQMVMVGIMNVVSGFLSDHSRKSHADLPPDQRPPPLQSSIPLFFAMAITAWVVLLILFIHDLYGPKILVNGIKCKWSAAAAAAELEHAITVHGIKPSEEDADDSVPYKFEDRKADERAPLLR